MHPQGCVPLRGARPFPHTRPIDMHHFTYQMDCTFNQ